MIEKSLFHGQLAIKAEGAKVWVIIQLHGLDDDRELHMPFTTQEAIEIGQSLIRVANDLMVDGCHLN
ncbi:MAG: hypothetical protein JXM70_23315 [Pirellulales bacterium]|nr:hypothetical protein [Pirellulales bacterium]